MGEARAAISVLHLDDDPEFLEMAAAFLERQSDRIAVESATSVDEGLDRIADSNYDCIVSDYDMPSMDGIELLETVRRDYPAVPFILYTGKGSEEVASEAISAGVTDYLQKRTGTSHFEVLANRIENSVEQRRAQQKVAEAEERLQTLTENSNDILWQFTADWDDLLFINSPYEEIWGQSIEELREAPRSFLEGIHPDDRPLAKDAMEQLSAGEPVDIEYRVNPEEQYGRWVWAQGEPVFDEEGAVEKIVGFARDITDRKEREREVRRLKEEYEVVFNNVRDSLFLTDVVYSNGQPEFRIRNINPANAEALGLSSAAVGGETPVSLLGEELGRQIEARYRECLEKGEPLNYEERLSTGDDTRVFETTLTPVEIDGEIRHIVGVAHDITERSKREEELERYETIIEALGDPVYALDADGHYTFVNEAYVDESGYAREELIGQHPTIRTPDQYVEKGRSMVKELLEDDERRTATWEFERYTADGELAPAENHMALLPMNDGEFRGTAGVIRDISDRKQRERKLNRLQQRSQEFMYTETKQETARVAVEAAEDIIGSNLNGVHLLDESEAGLEPVVVSDAIQDTLDGAPTFHRDADEGTRDAVVWETFEADETRYLQDTQANDALTTAVVPRSVLVHSIGDHGVFMAAGREPDAFDTTDRALFDVLATSLTTALDRVDREQTLRNRTEELKRQKERIDEFASMVSHDLKNPLSIAKAGLELELDESDSENLRSAENALDRMDKLIEKLLSLAQAGDIIEDTQATELSTRAHQSWRAVEADAAELVVEDDVIVEADRTLLQQLLENLLQNATEHGGSDVTVRVGRLSDGFYIADDGPGIPPEERDEVLEPGVTSDDGGTGLGLTIVRDIAYAHGWELDVAESADGGARFEITDVEVSEPRASTPE